MKAAILSITILGFATVASADALRTQIAAQDVLVNKALLNKDVSAFSAAVKSYIAPGFKYSEGKMTMNFDQMVAGMKQGLAAMTKVTEADSKLLSLKTSGTTATAIMVHHMVGLVQGSDKKTHVSAFSGVSHDVYQLSGGKWKMSSMTFVTSEMRLDGHKMDMSKMGK